MSKLALHDPFAVIGQWHRPEEPERMLHGQLSRSAKGVELKLEGAFCQVEDAFEGQLHAYPTIHGVCEDFGAVSLLQVHQSGLTRHTRPTGLQVFEKLEPWALVVGAHVSPTQLYPRMRFRIPGLHLWLARPLVERSLDLPPAPGTKSWIYRVPELEPWTTRIDSIGAALDWEVHSRESGSKDPFSGVQMQFAGWITIRPDSPQSLEWFLAQESRVSHMLAWLAGSTMSADRIEVFVETFPHRASLILNHRDRTPCTLDQIWKFFMPRSAMGRDLGEAVVRWFEVFPAIEKPCSLAHNIFASDNLWTIIKFLMWIQTLEGLHHGLEDAAEAGTLPPDVTMPLARKKRKTLQERLDALVDALPQPYRHWVLGFQDTIPYSWIRTRNYYTHWYKEQEEGTLSVQGMHVASVRMEHLCRAIFLVIMGVSPEALAETLKGSGEVAQALLGINAAEQSQGPQGGNFGSFLSDETPSVQWPSDDFD